MLAAWLSCLKKSQLLLNTLYLFIYRPAIPSRPFLVPYII